MVFETTTTRAKLRDGPPQHVLVVGGGVAGMCVAYFLRRSGVNVTVLEGRRLGSGASSGNAGWLSPAQAGPLPEPGLIGEGLRTLVRPDAALYVAPSYLPRILPWLVRFAARCNEHDYRRGAEALARLGRRTFELAEEIAGACADVEIDRRGLLVAAERPEHAREFLRRLEPLRPLGYRVPDEILAGAEARELEPLLSDSVSGALMIDQHWHVHPATMMGVLAARLREMDVTVEEGAEVQDLVIERSRVRELHTSAGSFECDAMVLAAGAWSARLARRLGLRLPMQAGKGYSVDLALDGARPTRDLLLLEPHVACTGFGGTLRLAGTMEFSGVNGWLDTRRVDSILRGAARLVPSVGSATASRPWAGMRPIAPDGLPIVDRAPRPENVYLATAYSMLGMTLAAPAGESLAKMILAGERPPELDAFKVTRFAGVRA